MTPARFDAALQFLGRLCARTAAELGRAKRAGMKDEVDITIGFRRSEDYQRFWQAKISAWHCPLATTEVHFYDDFAARDGVVLLNPGDSTPSAASQSKLQSLLSFVPSSQLWVGEAEGHSVDRYVRQALERRLKGVAFWQLRSVDKNDDGFLVDLPGLWATMHEHGQAIRAHGAWIGLNLPWLYYGRDFGTDEYNPATSGVSMPVNRAWLRQLLQHAGPKAGATPVVLRVFVGTDWRTGLEYVASTAKSVGH
jgi:hypothetical protein